MLQPTFTNFCSLIGQMIIINCSN